jgi:putative transposase
MRWHAHYHTSGTGHIYQGRFKSFPIEADDHLLRVLRYVERNALRANLVKRAQDWRWSSLWRRCSGDAALRESLADWPVAEPKDWVRHVNQAETDAELEALRRSVMRSQPYGSEAWTLADRQAAGLGIHATAAGPAEKGDRPDSKMSRVPFSSPWLEMMREVPMSNPSDLYHAFDEGDFPTIDALAARHGVNWITESDKWNLLHRALLSVTRAPNPAVIRHLIDLGVDVNAKDRRLWSPLHFAARTKSSQAVKLLIDAGAEIDPANDEGVTPLHQSLLENPWNLEIMEMLLAAGAEPTDMARNFINAVADPEKDALLGLLAKYKKGK